MKSLTNQWRATDQNLVVRISKNSNREDQVQGLHLTKQSLKIIRFVQTTQTHSLSLGCFNSFTKYKAEEVVENKAQVTPASDQDIIQTPQHFISRSGIKETEL